VKHASISLASEADIEQIAEYTINAWGRRQTDRYLDQLEGAFQILAEHPSIGRSCDSILADLMRFEVGKHVVFYQTEQGGIHVIRVLHQQMLPAKSKFES